MNRIKNVSLFFRLMFQILLIVLPVSMVISWVYAPDEIRFFIGIFYLNAIPDYYSKLILHTLTTHEKIMGCLVATVPMLVKLFVLYCLINLFKLYEKGNIFSIKHVRYIRNIGYALLVDQLIIQPVYQFAMGVVLTMHNPPHHRVALITFDQTNVGILLTALVIILISWIMAEGCHLQEEQQLTI